MSHLEARLKARTPRAAVLPLLSMVLAGCSMLPGLAGPAATDPAAARSRAAAVLGAWADAVQAAGSPERVTPMGELTGQVGAWEPEVVDHHTRALNAGAVATEMPLPDDAPAEGEVTWPDGTTTAVPLIQAQQAIGAMAATTAPSCGDCSFVLVTGSRLTSGSIQTTRGPATAPIWEFTVRDSAVKLTRVAIGNAVTVAPADGDPELGLAIDAASGSVTRTELTVAFVGAPRPGNEPCGEDYTGEAIESDLAVVVIVTRHPRVGGTETCPAVGARRTTTATLAAPLGARAVLDFQAGAPVPLVVAP